jgi:hypothetical protein
MGEDRPDKTAEKEDIIPRPAVVLALKCKIILGTSFEFLL